MIESGQREAEYRPNSSLSPEIMVQQSPFSTEVLHLSTRTVREYLKRDEIRGKLIGKRWSDSGGIPPMQLGDGQTI